MPSLTDRYVFTVLRQIPEPQRADLERELRSSIADLVDARVDAGATTVDAEDGALRELGDPALFAAGITGRRQYLVGPEAYPAWLQLLRLVLAIVVPIASVAHAIVLAATGGSLVDVLVGLFTTAFSVSLHIMFWVTLVFVILERTGTATSGMWQPRWAPQQLPEYASDRRTIHDLVAELVWVGVLAVVLIGQQFWSFSVINGERVPLLAPAEWSFWWPYFLVVLGAQAVFDVWIWRRGGWSWTAAAVNIAISLAAAVPLIWLALEQRIWNPAFFDELGWSFPDVGTTDVITVGTVASVVIIFVVSAVQALLNAWRAQSGMPAPVPGTGVRV